MPDRPELPVLFRARFGSFTVLPDAGPMRWTLWDLDGCIGEFSLAGDVWSSHPDHQPTEDNATHASWQGAAQAVVSYPAA